MPVNSPHSPTKNLTHESIVTPGKNLTYCTWNRVGIDSHLAEKVSMWYRQAKLQMKREAAISDDDPGTSELSGWLDERVKAEEGRFRNLAREPFSFYSPGNETVYMNPAQYRQVQRTLPSMRHYDYSGQYLNPAEARDLSDVVNALQPVTQPGREQAGMKQFHQALQDAKDDGNHGLALVVPRREQFDSLSPEENAKRFHDETGKAVSHERIHREQDQLRPVEQRHLEPLTSRDLKPVLTLPESKLLQRFLQGHEYRTDPASIGAEGAAWLGSGDENAVFGRLREDDAQYVNVAARNWLAMYAQAVVRKYGFDALKRLFRFSSPLTKEVILAVLGPESE